MILLLHHNPNFNPNLSLTTSLITTTTFETLAINAMSTARKRGEMLVLRIPVTSEFVQFVQKKANAS